MAQQSLPSRNRSSQALEPVRAKPLTEKFGLIARPAIQRICDRLEVPWSREDRQPPQLQALANRRYAFLQELADLCVPTRQQAIA